MDSVVPVPDLAALLGSRIGQLSRLLAHEAGGPSRTQLSVLATLRDLGPRRITELADSERVAQPTMTGLITRLEGHGWVARGADPVDGRAVNVALTGPGRDVLAQITAARAGVLDRRLTALASDQRAAIAAALPALDRLLDADV
jgi:DNA-binding MarR family transcriptional regulator